MGKRELSILVIEKDRVLSDLLEFWIRCQRHVVLSASDGLSGYLKASAGPFDVIIVDVDSLGQGGIRLIGNLRDIQPEASIFAIVPFGKEDFALQAFQEGADHIMEKPISIDHVKEYLSSTTNYVH
jgi:DNA-binding response OmpR family regulator